MLYADAPTYLGKHLQILINTAARVVADCPRFSAINGSVRDVLHWLPAAQQIELKVATFAFKALKGLAPEYLTKFTVPSALELRRPGLPSSSELILSLFLTCYALVLINKHAKYSQERGIQVRSA